MTAPAPARTSRISAFTAYSAVSLAVAALTFTGHLDLALTIAVPAYGWLQAQMHQRVRRVEASLGPVNGENVHELLERLVEHDDYSHGRNHDILGALTPPNAGLALLLFALCDRLDVDAVDVPELRSVLATALERTAPPTTEGT